MTKSLSETVTDAMTDTPDQDHYTEKLVEVNKTNAVVTTEAVYNKQGGLLVPKGVAMTPDVAKRIAMHKLGKPLELSIALEKSITGPGLIQQFTGMLVHPELKEIFTTRVPNGLLLFEAEQLGNYPLLIQKLTVMQECMPVCYANSLIGAVLTLQVSDELGFSAEDRHATFVAALARDIGMLHIAPEITEKDDGLSAEEWQLYTGHVAISYHLLSLMPNMPKLAKVAVLEHHERTDGFGYPRGRAWPNLTLAGQVVAFCDMSLGLFERYVLAMGYSVRALTPIAQVNANRHTRDVTAAALRALDMVAGPTTCLHKKEELGKLQMQLSCAQPLVKLLFEQIEAFWQTIQEMAKDADLSAIGNALEDLRRVFATSGLTEPMVSKWVNELEVDTVQESDILELESFALMLAECTWQFSELFKTLKTFKQRDQLSPEALEYLDTNYATIKKTFYLLTKIRARETVATHP